MEYSIVNPLPSLLKYFRMKRGLTQKDAAEALAISRSGYANYEEGRTLPSIEQTIRLSELLNHDLLYAYTLSSRYMQAANEKRALQPVEMVMEANTYIASLESGSQTVTMLDNYKLLSSRDKMLIDSFVENLASKQNEAN